MNDYRGAIAFLCTICFITLGSTFFNMYICEQYHKQILKELDRDVFVNFDDSIVSEAIHDAFQEYSVDPAQGCQVPVYIYCVNAWHERKRGKMEEGCGARTKGFCFEEYAAVWALEHGWISALTDDGRKYYLCNECKRNEENED